MKLIAFLYSLLAASLLSGCFATGPSSGPFYTEESVESNDSLVGVWQSDSLTYPKESKSTNAGQTIPFVVSPVSKGTYLLVEQNTNVGEGTDEERYPEITATTFKVGTNTYLNLTLADTELEKLAKYGPLLLPTHWLVRYELSGDELKIYGPELNLSLTGGTRPAANPFPMLTTGPTQKQTLSNNPTVRGEVSYTPSVISATPAHLQRAIVEGEANGFFASEATVFRRVKPTR